MSIIETLKQSELFKDLQDHELALVAATVVETQLPTDAVLLTQHEPAPAVFILKSGAVKVMVNGEIVAQISTVQCFGEMSCVVPDTVATASVVTLGNCQLLSISKAAFLQMLDDIPRLWRALFLQSSERLKTATRRQSEILQHTPQGFMKLDRAARVTNEYSLKCARYFGKDNLAGVSFAGLVSGDNAAEQASWFETYAMLFEDSFMAFEDLTGLLTQELKLPSPDGDSEYVFSYHASRGADGAVTAVDVGVEDVTAQRKLERANEALKAQQDTLGKIHENPEIFFEAAELLTRTLAEVTALAQSLASVTPLQQAARLEDSMRQLHSLKGLAGMFALKPVQAGAHELESAILAFAHQTAITAEQQQGFQAGLARLADAQQSVQGLIDKMGSALRQRLTGTVLSEHDLARLRAAVAQGDLAAVASIMAALEAVDASRLFSAWASEVARLAQDLGKQARFELSGEGGKLDKPVFDALSKVFPHLLSNALCHGIELPEVREAAGKPGTGTLQVVLAAEAGMLRIQVADDGRGLDFQELPAKARQKTGLNQALVDDCERTGQPWRILLLPGFSTASEVSLLSGRGVGLDAIDHAVRSVGGHILIDSTAGQGMTFTLHVPLPTLLAS
jgi:two-component system chemotaxis sensor kinase CheA